MPDPGLLRSRRGAVVGGVAAVLVVGAAVGAVAATSSGGSRYRTAEVAAASVDQTLTAVGTASPSGLRTVSPGTSGRVVRVSVAAGQAVKAGQELAAIDDTALALANAQALNTVAQAKLRLAQQASGESTSDSGTATGSGGQSTVGPISSGAVSGSSRTSSSTSSSPEVKAVTAAQQAVDQDLAAATTAISTAARTCGLPTTTSTRPTSGAGTTGTRPGTMTLRATAPTGSRPTGSAPTGTTPTAPTGTTPTTSTGTTAPTTGGSTGTSTASTAAACLAAEQKVLVAQEATAKSETALFTAEQRLDAATQRSSSTQSSGGGTSTSTTTVSAAQIAADQAAVDSATANAAVAAQALRRAVLTAPIAGTVLSVGLTAGAQVSAGSTSAAVVLVASSQFTFGITVPVTALASLKVGDAAVINPDGGSAALRGSVAAIGVAPTTAGGSNYAVTIGLDSPAGSVRSGSTASVVITEDAVAASAAVPTSALTRIGSSYSVRVLAKGTVRRVAVQTGVRGTDLTQILSGVQAGDRVVIADLHAALPSSDTSTTIARRLTGNVGGGLGGGFGAGAGLGTGAPPSGARN